MWSSSVICCRSGDCASAMPASAPRWASARQPSLVSREGEHGLPAVAAKQRRLVGGDDVP